MPGAQPRPGLAGGLVDECVRFFLMPLEARPGPIEPDREPVFFPAGDLRTAERAFRPALQPQEDAGVIVQAAARHEGAEFRA